VKAPGDTRLGPLIIVAAVVGWLLGLALLFYVATLRA
jgi:hypothetical protein